MSDLKYEKWFPGEDEVKTVDVSSVDYRTEPHKVVSLTTSGSHQAASGNWINKVKTVGTLSEYVAISSLLDMDGNELLSADLFLDESDELQGPFSKVVVSGTQPALTGGGAINLMVWEFING